MHTAIADEESLTPESTLPVQFQHIWHGSKTPATPERALATSVLWQALHDLQRFRYARRRKRQRLYMDAYSWVESNDRSWPYSFVNICETLGISANSLRAEFLEDTESDREQAA
jgi:hypothetical protein